VAVVWKNPWYDPSLKHHTPNGFRNTDPVGHQPGDLDRWRKARKEAGLPKPPALGYDDLSASGGNRLSLRNLMKMGYGGWDTRACCCSWTAISSLPIRFFHDALLRSLPGTTAQNASRLSVDQLHQLDAVVISHNHYDHLDDATIRRILKRFPDVSFVPLGLADWFRRRGQNAWLNSTGGRASPGRG
jgi:hypothetical protein